MSKSMIQLTLNEGEARLVSLALQFYARVRMGQFGEIVWYCAKNHCPEDRDAAEKAWLELRKQLYPDLLMSAGHTYGYGKFDDADKAYDVHQAICCALGAEKETFIYHKLPKCERVNEGLPMIKSRNITIKPPKDIECNKQEWKAKYVAKASPGVVVVRIESRSAIDVLITKIAENGVLGPQTNYCISSPNFGIAIPGVSSLLEGFWITEQLLNHGMPAPDAVTLAQVLCDLGDF